MNNTNQTKRELTYLFMKIDANCDGTVDWDEFTNFLLLENQGADNSHHQLEVIAIVVAFFIFVVYSFKYFNLLKKCVTIFAEQYICFRLRSYDISERTNAQRCNISIAIAFKRTICNRKASSIKKQITVQFL